MMNRQELFNELDTDTATNVIVNELLDNIAWMCDISTRNPEDWDYATWAASGTAALGFAITTVLFHNRAPVTGYFRTEIAALVAEVIATEAN